MIRRKFFILGVIVIVAVFLAMIHFLSGRASPSLVTVEPTTGCDQDFSTSSLWAAWSPLVGAWRSVDANTSFGDEIDFTSHTCGDSYGFRSYAYNPNTGVSQPMFFGMWKVSAAGLVIIDDNETSSPYAFPRFSAASSTLSIFHDDGTRETYTRIVLP